MEHKNQLIQRVIDRFLGEFGMVSRRTSKVLAWNLGPKTGIVLQIDQPSRGAAYVWLPYPPDGQTIPEIAFEYPAESGRHSNTYPSPGLSRGFPALKLLITTEAELHDTVAFVKALRDAAPLPDVCRQIVEPAMPLSVDASQMPEALPPAPRREAIPRVVQREVWQRDAGRCVECGTREKLCFDHIVPFSRGGSNTVRNIQLLCEGCNLTKGNRI
ncbi:HNH endonuclease [Paraburkholderia silviterrae]|uniref:HNH endonuclease n=2 Tax=Paraburkholderia silviterrae TaxID=2528715 RepID=A0A4R5MDU1_9BURK|nr:HNH endonuclease [Paraburkholderia silviterrae]